MTTAFNPGRVIGRSLSILSSNAGALVLTTLVMQLPLIFLNLYFTTLEAPTDPRGQIQRMLVAQLVGLVPQALGSAAVTYGALQHLRGRAPGIVESLRFGARRLLPALGTSVAISLVMFAGLVACMVPCVFFACVFFVAIPVAVVEGGSPIDALRRSGELTQGSRWSIFALLLFLFCVLLVLLLIAARTTFQPSMAAVGGSRAHVLASHLLVTLVQSLHAVMAAVAYHALRVQREGEGAGEIASSTD
jgi:hypothetical protein